MASLCLSMRFIKIPTEERFFVTPKNRDFHDFRVFSKVNRRAFLALGVIRFAWKSCVNLGCQKNGKMTRRAFLALGLIRFAGKSCINWAVKQR